MTAYSEKDDPPPVKVSDHALVRWLERVGGIDMEYFRREIAERCEDLAAAGACGGWIDEHWVVLDHGKVVTFLPDRPDSKMRLRHHDKKMRDLD